MAGGEAIRAFEWIGGLDALRRRELRRLLAASALAHVLVLVLLAWSPRPSPRVALPAVVSVDLVAVAPGASAPRAAPRPKPPVSKKVVLPAQPSAPKPKPKAEPKPEPKPKPRVEPETPQKSYEELLEELKEKAGDAAEPPQAQPRTAAAATGIAGGASSGVRVSPEVAGWLRRARVHVRQSWIVAPGFRDQDLETHVRVRLDAQGNIVGDPELVRRSGNPWYDDSVLRALAKASPLPPPPEEGDWPFVFRPEDVL